MSVAIKEMECLREKCSEIMTSGLDCSHYKTFQNWKKTVFQEISRLFLFTMGLTEI